MAAPFCAPGVLNAHAVLGAPQLPGLYKLSTGKGKKEGF
jgi:hypothetical protein